MGFKVKIPASLGIFALLLCLTSSTPIIDIEPLFQKSLENFSKNMFGELLQSKEGKNIIYSPFSIQTCLAMTRMGAEGQTADEMDQRLGFAGKSTETIADDFHSILSKYEKSKILKIANKVYVAKDYELADKYNDILLEKFFSAAENVDFSESDKAAETMNSWVETKTNNAIKDLIDPSMVSSDSRMFLLSAIHFKGNWKSRFNQELTEEKEFFIDETNSVKLQMMYKSGKAEFGFLSDLEALALRLPYEDSDLSMFILLPNTRNGLSALQEKLKNHPLESLTKKLNTLNEVSVFLPKFKAEFNIELSDILKKMGMEKMFGDADFSKMFKSSESVAIGHVIHKAVIEVNEEGTEAAAATASDIVAYSGPPQFNANHPFYYVIMNEDSVPLFEGTFVGV